MKQLCRPKMNIATEPNASHLGDVAFDITQLFYSRTDKRGVIQAGNSFFQTISGYEWGQLIGAPHRILRNYDTPRAVFRILWAMIQAGEPAVAYIRNKTADGRGYWVIALILPTEDGYLSVRIKPTSALFDKIKAIYAALSAAEKDSKLDVEQGEARLLEELAKLGYSSYADFGRAALLGEQRARSQQMGARSKGYYSDLDRIQAGLTAIKSAQADLLTSVESLRDLPTNMRIVASRLEPSGGPLSAMSDIYNSTSTVLFKEINEFVLGQNSISKRASATFEKYQFLKAAYDLLHEVAASSANEAPGDSGVNLRQESNLMTALTTQMHASETEALHVAERQAQDLNRAAYDLRRSMLGLDTIRVMGLVESGRLGAEGSRIGATMEQIGACHHTTITLLQQIKDNATVVNAGVEGLRLHGKKSASLAAS